MNKIVEIAKANGAVIGNDWESHWTYSGNLIFESEDQLRATVEQVCAPLVEALNGANELFELMYGINQKAPDSVIKCKQAIASYRAIIGDKHE